MKGIIFILAVVLSGVVMSAQEKAESRPPSTTQWSLSEDYTEEINIPLDTLFPLFHRYRTADRYSPFNVWMGNYGQPLYQINFFDRITDPDKFLYRYYYPFMYLPCNSVFMNTRVPFTEMTFTYAGPREMADQTFRIKHSQNVNRNLNFGLIYDIIYSLGQYSYQRTDDKSFTFFSSYRGQRYKLYFSSGINSMTTFENGGITDEEQLKTYKTRDVEVRLGALNKARSVLKNSNILLVQRFSLLGKSQTSDSVSAPKKGFAGLSGTVSHIFIWEKTRRLYNDSYPLSGFYDTSNIFISRTATFDSLSERSIKNTVRFDFSTDPERKFRLGGGVGISNELFRYSQIVPSEGDPPSDTVHRTHHNNLLKASLFNDIGKRFKWRASGELFLTGYRAGDFTAHGYIYKAFGQENKEMSLKISGGFSSVKPSVWLFRWGSNHYVWDNNFLKEFRVNAGAEISLPYRRMDARFNYTIIDNYTDFGPDSMPAQHRGGLSVAAIYAGKEMSVWKFHLSNQILIQKSSNRDILDLPLVTLRMAGFFEHDFYFRLTGGNLNTQLGVDLFYYTPYYGYGYVPATGSYFRQSRTLTGNYPYINAFLNVKIKRTRIFLVLDHVNSGFTGYNYFMVPGYPMNIRAFRYGIAWTFYD